MIGLAFSDVALGVFIGILAIELVAIVWAMWRIHRNLQKIEETVEQSGRVR